MRRTVEFSLFFLSLTIHIPDQKNLRFILLLPLYILSNKSFFVSFHLLFLLTVLIVGSKSIKTDCVENFVTFSMSLTSVTGVNVVTDEI